MKKQNKAKFRAATKRKQQRAIAARIHIQTEINRRLFRASNLAKIMQITMLYEHTHPLSNTQSACIFSYLADDLIDIQNLFEKYS